MNARPAAVAGSFYPRSPDELGRVVDGLLAATAPAPGAPKALVVPHAGYVYSGPIAASAYSHWRSVPAPVRVVMLGPAHYVGIRGLALPEADALETPLGRVELDPVAASLAGIVQRSAAVHAREHCLEVQLPFLQRLWPTGLTVVPLAVGRALADDVASVLDRLWDGSRILISSDLSHYLPYDAARDVDRRTADAIVRLAPDDLDDDDACGSAALRGFLTVARRRGMTSRLLDLRNSGDTAGEKDRVVGYGAFAFHEGPQT